jgi:hypothetical protein
MPRVRANEAMTPEQLTKLKERLYKAYGRQHLHDTRNVWLEKDAHVLRHEDPQLGGSGWWVTVDVFVPDDKEK